MKTKMMLMMMLGACFITSQSFANADTTIVEPIRNDTNDTTIVYDKTFIIQEEIAEFPGGDAAMEEYFATSIQYPVIAKTQGIEGEVIVSFYINENGTAEDLVIINAIGGNCEQEVLSAITNMPLWKPAIQAGHRIRTKKMVAIKFQLS